MSTERKEFEPTRDPPQHDELWRCKIQRALRDLRSMSHETTKELTAS